MFEVQKRNGVARVGKWLLKEQNKEVTTPNILFFAGQGITPPKEAEFLISEEDIPDNKPYILSTPGLFMEPRGGVSDYSVSPSLIYPPSQVELNAYAAKINKDVFSGKLFVVSGKDEAVTSALEGVKAEMYLLANALQLVRKPKSFVNTLVNLRKAVGYQRLIYTPGLGSPHHIALLVYCGVDLFDSASSLLNARLGNYLTAQGKVNRDEMAEDFCFCPSCVGGKRDYESILGHNYYASLAELRTVRNAIRSGGLRELVETRVRSEPQMVSILRILDTHHYSFLEKYFPITGGQMIASSSESLTRPEIVRFRERVKERYKKTPYPKILLLLPCS
ncbi:MAG: hypothetical protein JSV56_06035, partial [Methanomassiliicoccales archaeon]